MLCDICKKNEATIHIQEIVNEQKKGLHLCGDCAAEKAKTNPMFNINGFNLAEMLYNISANLQLPHSTTPSATAAKHKNLKCPECNWELEGLKKHGRLGCPKCYKVFHEIINEALENMHRGKLHVGKRPGTDGAGKSSQLMLELMRLQKELTELVQREEYEQAAGVRDKISAVKKKLNKQE